MRNLKRALSLALASVMVLGMMVVGAGAASFDSFGDKDKVVNKEAVSILNNLNVINGKDDGNFDPTGIVTRAEMAKMICVVLNGGKDPNLGTTATTTYSDTAGNWAAAYIEFCTTKGIVGGDGTGKFNPTNTVTGAEAAKMLLVAMGYNATYEKMVGAQWATSVNVLANTKGLYDGLTIDPGLGLSRDDAAQMIYNALNANMVKYDNAFVTGENGSLTSIPTVNELKTTLLNDTFKAVRVEGVVTANEVANLAVDNNALDAGKTRIAVSNGDELKEAMGTANDNGFNSATPTFEIGSGMDVLGKAVILYVKPSNAAPSNSTKATIVGEVIVDVETNTVVVDSSKDKLADVADDNNLTLVYEDDDASKITQIAKNYGNDTDLTEAMAKAASKRGVERTLIDNDGDGEVEYVLETTFEFGKVTKYATKDDGSITVRVSTGTWTKDDSDDVIGFDDVAKDDYVLAAQIGGKLYVEKAETVTGELDRYKSGSTLTVDGTVYNVSGVPAYNDSDLTTADPGSYTNTGNEATFYLDKAGNIVAVGEATESASQYALIVGYAHTENKIDTDRAKVVLSDGTTGTYYVDKVQMWDASEDDGKGKWVDVKDSDILADDKMKGRLISYSINSDDEILIRIADTDQSGADDQYFIGKDLTADTGKNSKYIFSKGKTSVQVEGHNYYANSSTVFFYAKEDDTKADVYLGNKAAPSVDFNGGEGETTTYRVILDGSTIKAIAVSSVTASAAGDYIYLYNYLGGNSDVSNFDAIVNGEIKEDIAVSESGRDADDYGLYEFTQNADEEYDLTPVNYEDSSYVRGVVSKVSGDSIYIGGTAAANEYILQSDSVVALAKEDDTALGETVEKGDYVVAVLDDKEITAIIITEEFVDDDLSLTKKTDSTKDIVIDDDTITLGEDMSWADLSKELEKGSEDAKVTCTSSSGNLKETDTVTVASKSGKTSKTYSIVLDLGV